MSKLIIVLMLIISSQLSCGNEYFASAMDHQDFPSKRYVCPDQISICEDGILVYTGKRCLLTQSIFHDEDGFYYLEEGVYWICQNCGALNDLDNKVCYRCKES